MLTRSRLVLILLLSVAALDITRCSLVVMTYRHFALAAALVAAGVAMAAVTVITALGYRTGRRWAAAVALLIGLASAPQASSSGFRPPFTIPDVATAILGVALAVAILASAGRGVPRQPTVSPCAKSADPAAMRSSARDGYEG